jgi:HSP20 family protein
MTLDRWRPRWGVTPWRSMGEIENWERQLENLFGRSMWRFPLEDRSWMPAIDVFEKDDKFIVKAELPGMKEDDIDVSIVGSTLAIRGEKKTESEVKETDYYRSERAYGSFYRSIPLPSTVDTGKIQAEFEDGVLEVSLPKLAGEKPKKVAVTASKKSKAAAKRGTGKTAANKETAKTAVKKETGRAAK